MRLRVRRVGMQQKLGKWSLRFTEAPFILESSSVVGTKEADGPLGGLFDIVGKDDRFGQNTWEKAESSMQRDVAGFSESHFMRYFKETMGTSFVDYLKDYRLTMAARLLQSSDSSVLSISGEVGFESLSYFNRAFKKHYGMTPLQYRKGS